MDEVFTGEERSGDLGEYYLCRHDVGALMPSAVSLVDRLRRCAAPHAGTEDVIEPQLLALCQSPLEDWLFLDLETAGLSAAPLFLVGVLRVEGDGMLVEQYLARDYAEEPSMLWEFGRAAERAAVLVTFNGKSFDVPYLRDRMSYYHLPWEESFEHVDLLHLARRRWRGVFPNCRLQTLEERLCFRTRTDDIPGELIPERYHEFVGSQDASLMAPVLHHNWLDLVTMVEVLNELLAGKHEGRRSSSTDAPRSTGRERAEPGG